jgi:hypothetical protein
MNLKGLPRSAQPAVDAMANWWPTHEDARRRMADVEQERARRAAAIRELLTEHPRGR